MVDLWSDPALGGSGTGKQLRSASLKTADEVTASAPDLVDRAREPLGESRCWSPTPWYCRGVLCDPGPLPNDFPPGDGRCSAVTARCMGIGSTGIGCCRPRFASPVGPHRLDR